MDKILINEIRGYGYVGFFSAEKELGQWFSVNLSLSVNLHQASISDRLQDTVDYKQIIEITQQTIRQYRCDLIEHLAAKITEEIFKQCPIQDITITLTKLSPPIADFSGTVSIELFRRANQN